LRARFHAAPLFERRAAYFVGTVPLSPGPKFPKPQLLAPENSGTGKHPAAKKVVVDFPIFQST
jgi:hypothetical protein